MRLDRVVGIVLGGSLGLALDGCILPPGSPWGEVEASLEASFTLSESRQTESGALKTSNDYAITLSRVAFTLDALAISQVSDAASTFDPANPPEGYSLCHGGHCHADDGSLVSYEDIAASLGLSSSGYQVQMPIGAETELSDVSSSVVLGACSSDCQLEYGALSTVTLSLSAVSLSGLVQDATTQGRLPAEGVPFSLEMPLTLTVEAPLEGAADKTSLPLIRLAVVFPLTERFLDGIDWSQAATGLAEGETLTLESTDAAALQLVSNLDLYAGLEVSITREAIAGAAIAP